MGLRTTSALTTGFNPPFKTDQRHGTHWPNVGSAPWSPVTFTQL